MKSPSAWWPSHPKVERIRSHRRIYAWAANSLAILVVLTLLLSLTTREFRTFAKIELPIDPAADRGQLEPNILAAIKSASSDHNLADMIARMREEHQLNPQPPVEAIDFDLIRQNMRFAILRPDASSKAAVLIEYVGAATKTERELVHAFARSVYQMALTGSSRSPLVRNSAAAEEVASLVQLSEQIQRSLEQIANDLESHRFAMLNSREAENLKAAEIQHLDRQIAAKYGDDSDELAMFRQKYADYLPMGDESLDGLGQGLFRLASTEQRGGTNDSSGLKSLGELHELITSLPLADLQQRLQGLHLADATPMLSGAAGEPVPTASRQALGQVRQEPVGLMSHRGVLVGLMVCALGIGWVLSSGISPQVIDQGFGQPEEIERELGLPVVAKVRPLRGDAGQGATWSPDMFLRFSENVVLVAVILLAILAATNPEIRYAIWQHPLHAITNILWSVFH